MCQSVSPFSYCLLHLFEIVSPYIIHLVEIYYGANIHLFEIYRKDYIEKILLMP